MPKESKNEIWTLAEACEAAIDPAAEIADTRGHSVA
jgi:hypothetical protein